MTKLQDPIGTFLLRLVEFGKISRRDFDLEFGKQSGYPRCCIDYFLRLNSLGLDAAMVSEAVLGEDDPFIQYVRCPKCRQLGSPINIEKFSPVYASKLKARIAEYEN